MKHNQLPLFGERLKPSNGLSEIKKVFKQSQEKKPPRWRGGSWYNHHNGQGGTIKIFENEIQILEPKSINEETSPPKREEMDINKFTRKSRFRVLQKFNQLQTKALSAPVFLTLTTRHGSMSPAEFQNAFRKGFLPNLKKIVPKLVYAWRLEPHKDGYPHYHLFIWSWVKDFNLNSKRLKTKIRAIWLNCIRDDSNSARKYSCKIVPIGSIRKTMNYVGKYMAKEGNDSGNDLYGRRWGTSSNYPCAPIKELDVPVSDLRKLKKIVKRLLRQRGGGFLKSLEFLEDGKDWVLWIPFEMIHEAIRQFGWSSAEIALDCYAETGASPPPEGYGLDWFASKGIDLRSIQS